MQKSTINNEIPAIGNVLLCPVLSLSELQIGDVCLLKFKHPSNPFGDWTFRADYKVVEIDNGKYVFQSVTHPERDYKLLNIGDGYCEVVSKYRT